MKRLSKHSTLLGFLFVGLHLSTLPVLAQPIITTYAGGRLPLNGAQATTQDINQPRSVISDGAGGFYFASDDQRVYRVATDGVLTVIAGNGTTGFSGDGGPAVAAQLRNPAGIAKDAAGNLFITDFGNYRIRKVTVDGIISTVAGNGTVGFSGEGGPATSAGLSGPRAVAVDNAGNLFFVDSNWVRKVTSAGILITLVGNGFLAFSPNGGSPINTAFSFATSVAVDAVGNLFIADAGLSLIRKFTPAGVFSTVAGNGTPGSSGDGGPAVSAQLAFPRSVVVDTAGNLFIADSNSGLIRKVTSAGIISTVAGSTSGFGGDGGPATSARLSYAYGIAVDAAGNMFIADSDSRRIRKVTSAGIISTVAGSGVQTFSGDGGPATFALLFYPAGVAVDKAGNVFIADTSNHRIRKVTPSGMISTIAGNGSPGFSGDGGPAVSAQLSYPSNVAVDAVGNVFIADSSNHIRKVSPNGVITSLANIATGDFCPDFLNDYYEGYSVPAALAVDASGNLFIADSMNNRIRKVTPAGVISTVAGNGLLYGFSGDGGPAVSAQLFCPSGVAVDTAGNIFISDLANSRVRKVTPDGIIVTLAGTGEWGDSGDGGSAASARIGHPSGVAVDLLGNIFIADPENNRIREVSPAGIITSVAGTGAYGSGGDGGLAVSAQLSYPVGVAVDASGSLFIADTYNHRIRRVGLVLEAPAVAGVFPAFVAQGATVNVVLTGTSFISPLTMDAGSGVTVSNISVVTFALATATLTIASDADLGARSLTVSTVLGTSAAVQFSVVAPFPDLTIASSHIGSLTAGFNGVYAVSIVNAGSAPTTGALTVTDTLPTGLTFISGTGNGWSCSAAGQNVTCLNSGSLAVGASTTLTLTVAVSRSVASSVIHAPAVAVEGDLISDNDTASDATAVAVLAPHLQIVSTLVAGRQSSLRLTLPLAFPVDVSGTLLLSYASDTTVPVDDPTIQFETGGRVVSFTIPANTTEARFGDNPQAGPIGFQPGTVAGVLTFSGTVESGEVQTTFSTMQSIPRQAPSIQTLRTDSQNGFAVVITLLSTLREVKQLTLRFDTRPAVHLSCGSATGCAVSGSTMTFDVKALFDQWYAGDSSFGSLSTMRLPFSIEGTVIGIVRVTFGNSMGPSNTLSFPLP